MMEKEEKQNQIVFKPPPEAADLFLQWGNRKRLRRKITSRILTSATAFHKEISLLQPTRLTRNSEAAVLRSENRKSVSASPEKEDRYYTTRGSVAVGIDENGKASVEGGGERVGGDEKNRGIVWPKLYITLSSKEKEEDFMAMKGCKLPQRPKKRAKIIQRTLLLVSPGAWLTDMCQERYEVREKKSSKKRPRGLKAMGSMESDSE